MADALAHLNTGRTRVEWLAQLRPGYKPSKAYRRTSIIGTIGERCLIAILRNELKQLTDNKTTYSRSQDKLCRNHQCTEKRCVDIRLLRCSLNVIFWLSEVGLNIVRMNFSHGSYEVRDRQIWNDCWAQNLLYVGQYHQSVVDNAKNAEKSQPGRPLAIALDTVGILFQTS